MEDWKLIWNSFCDEVAVSVQKNNLEKVFEEDIARDFFTTLGWNRFKKELKEQYSVRFATATHRADFALFTLGKDTPEIIIELKRPKKKKEEKYEKFYKNADDFETAKKHDRFYLIKKIGESTSGKLTLSNMMQNGLKQAPLGALNLSDESFAQLLAYIEQNF